jgi:hypothetical protein
LSEYYIPNHVHFLIERDVAVFLDLRADQYSMLVGAKARAFNSMVARAPSDTRRLIIVDDQGRDDRRAVAADVVTELLRNGLLTATTPRGALQPLIYIPLPDISFIDSQEQAPADVAIRDVLRFIMCSLITRWRLRFASIENIVTSVERRKRLKKSDAPLDIRKARGLVRTYYRLRPFLPQDSMCLFDSLSLLDFLSKYDCFPNWVFAVRLEPWEAHCWVQYDTVAFNECTDRARAYLPLMAV